MRFPLFQYMLQPIPPPVVNSRRRRRRRRFLSRLFPSPSGSVRFRSEATSPLLCVLSRSPNSGRYGSLILTVAVASRLAAPQPGLPQESVRERTAATRRRVHRRSLARSCPSLTARAAAASTGGRSGGRAGDAEVLEAAGGPIMPYSCSNTRVESLL